MKYLFLSVALGLLIGTIALSGTNPDASVSHGGDPVASVVCGEGYFITSDAMRTDMQTIIRLAEETCEQQFGKETKYTHPDGALKHVVIIGDPETIRTKGSVYDVCVINYELTSIAAFAAFEDVCLNRIF